MSTTLMIVTKSIDNKPIDKTITTSTQSYIGLAARAEKYDGARVALVSLGWGKDKKEREREREKIR